MGKDKTALFSSNSDEWETPKDFYEKLNMEFGFTLDTCANTQNHKCERYITKEQNGLLTDWGGRKSILQSAL